MSTNIVATDQVSAADRVSRPAVAGWRASLRHAVGTLTEASLAASASHALVAAGARKIRPTQGAITRGARYQRNRWTIRTRGEPVEEPVTASRWYRSFVRINRVCDS
jgi:hypothetical protein